MIHFFRELMMDDTIFNANLHSTIRKRLNDDDVLGKFEALDKFNVNYKRKVNVVPPACGGEAEVPPLKGSRTV
jgi:hypothetical protein